MRYSGRDHFLLRFIAVLILTAFCIASASADAGQHERIVIGFREGSMQALGDADLSSMDIQIVDELTELDAVVVSASNPERFMEEVSQCPGVRFVERDIPIYALGMPAHIPDDQRYAEQWGPGAIGAEYAWNIERGENRVIIAVIDTGVDYTHPDMGNYVAGGYDWINNDGDPMDDHGHGTHCAGIVAAVSDNTRGIAGIAQAGIMAEKVLNFRGSGTSSLAAAAIRHAADNGADIISMSLGADEPSLIMEEACRYAWEKGCILVAASGNNGSSPINYPAAYNTVIAVGSVGRTGLWSSFSNYGTDLDLVAPGESILSTTPGNTYTFKSGTSMACPHVSGVAALLLSRYPGMANLDVRERLTGTADDLGAPGRDARYGYGRVNAFAALGGGEVIPPTIEADAGTVVRGENITLTLTGEGYREYRLSIDDAGMYPAVIPDRQGTLWINESAGRNETTCRVIVPESGTARVRYETDFSTAARPFTITVTDPKDASLHDAITVSVIPGAITITVGGRERFFFGEEVTLSGINTDNESTWLSMTGPGLDAGGTGLTGPGEGATGMVQVPVTGDKDWSYVWDTGALEGVLENGTYTLYAVSGPKAVDDLEGVASATVSLELVNSRWPAPEIAGISPDMVFAGNTSATILIAGSGFLDGATVLLKKEGCHEIVATGVHGNDTSTLSATFDLTATRAGAWDVAVRNIDGKTALLPGAFTVRVKGDLNNNDRVDIGDAALAAYMVVGKVPEDLLADFNQNGIVDIGDAAKVAYFVVGRNGEL